MKTALSALSEQSRGQMMEIRGTKGGKEKDRGGGQLTEIREQRLLLELKSAVSVSALVHDKGCSQKAKQPR